MTRSKVRARSHHDVAHLHLLTNVPTKYQLPTPYGFWDTAQTNFFPLPAQPPTRPPSHPDTMGENDTLTAIKGCWVIIQIFSFTYYYWPWLCSAHSECSYFVCHIWKLDSFTDFSNNCLICLDSFCGDKKKCLKNQDFNCKGQIYHIIAKGYFSSGQSNLMWTFIVLDLHQLTDSKVQVNMVNDCESKFHGPVIPKNDSMVMGRLW